MIPRAFPLVFLLVVGAAGCSGPAPEESGKIRLTVSERVLPDPGNMSITAQAERAVLVAFRERYPRIDVARFGGIQMPNVAMEVGPLMAIAGGISPDIIYVNFRKSNSYIMQGFLHPLDEYIATMPENELGEIVIPSVKPVVYREGEGKEKHWWALPFDPVVVALFYRKDLFHEAGLDPDRPPRDWNEMLEYARRITNPEKGIYGAGLASGPEASWHCYSFLLSAGARAVERNEDGEWRAAFGTPEAAEALYFYARLVQEEFEKDGRVIRGAATRDAELWRLWDEGKIGMFENYLYNEMMATVNPELIGIAPVCVGPTGLRGSEVNSRCMGLFAGVKDKATRDAAWEFMRFWAGREAGAIRTRVYVENGYGHFLNPANLRKYGYAEYLRRVPKGWERTFQEALAGGVPEPYGRNCDLVYWYLTRPMDRTLLENLGNRPPVEAKARILDILKEEAASTNEKMIGRVPPDKMRMRRLVALTAAVAIVLAFVFAFRYLMRVFTPTGARVEWGFRKYLAAYLIVLPAVLLMALWQYVPTVRGAIMAFMDYRIMGGSGFVGLDNFANVLYDREFWWTFFNSVYYCVLTLALGFVAPIALAILLHEVPRGKVFFRVVFYLPAVVSGLVVIFLWKSFYHPTDAGLMNRILNFVSLGMIPAQGWLSDPKWAMLCVVLPMVWAAMGPASLIYLAALKTVPDELYEAADIDGANTWHKLWNVTIPTLKPLIIISFIGAFVAAFKTSDFILAMTGGGPAGSVTGATMVMELQIFYLAFAYLKFGIATAMAWLMGFVLLGFTVYQMKRLSRMQFTTAADQ